MAAVDDFQGLHEILQECTSNLQSLILKLKETYSTQLQRALHDDVHLPDKKTEVLAADAVNLLQEAQNILQPAHLILADHFLGYTDSKCLVAAVKLGIPDSLASEPKSLQTLASDCSARPDRLRQVLRPLINNNIFSYDEATELYSNNHVSKLLGSAHWTQWHNWVELYGTEFYDIARGIPESVKKDATRSAAQINFDTEDSMFTYFQERGWVPRLHRTLGGGATAMAPGILADYPWEEVANSTVIDVGGGSGALIASLLRAHPYMKGGVFDLEGVIGHIAPFFAEGGQYADLEDRVPRDNLIAGDFLKHVPASEVYTMKWVLHDWNDEDAVTILRNIRNAMIVNGNTSRLIVLEAIYSDGRSARLSRLADINMMMMTANGHERTEAEWKALSSEAGWSGFKVFQLRRSWVQAIELRPK